MNRGRLTSDIFGAYGKGTNGGQYIIYLNVKKSINMVCLGLVCVVYLPVNLNKEVN